MVALNSVSQLLNNFTYKTMITYLSPSVMSIAHVCNNIEGGYVKWLAKNNAEGMEPKEKLVRRNFMSFVISE